MQDQIRDQERSNSELLQRVKALEDKRGEWVSNQSHHTAPLSDVMALTSTVADELQSRKDKEQNLVVFGLEESAEHTESEDAGKDKVCYLLSSLEVPSPNISTVFRMGRL